MTLADKFFIKQLEARIIRMLSEERRHLYTNREIQAEIDLLNSLKAAD